MTRIPVEFLIVAECCRWPPRRDDALAARWADEPLDWARVARIAKRHRVQGLVWNRLRSSGMVVPDEVARTLRAAAERIARDNLHAVRECLRLKAAFDAAGVPILFIKGVTLAMLAYGTLGLKAGWDIDVLVDEGRIDAAARTLMAADYRCAIPKTADLEQLKNWHKMSKESVWQHSATKSVVELHTRLVDNGMLLPAITLDETQSVAVGDGFSLPTLGLDELFAYLCVHGAWSAWYRLKWVADLAALVSQMPSAELGRIYERAMEHGSGRAPAIGLILCERVLGLSLPDRLRSELARSPVARVMASTALRMMAGRYVEREIYADRFGTLPMHLMRPFMLRSWRFTLTEVRRQIAMQGLCA